MELKELLNKAILSWGMDVHESQRWADILYVPGCWGSIKIEDYGMVYCESEFCKSTLNINIAVPNSIEQIKEFFDHALAIRHDIADKRVMKISKYLSKYL